MAPAFRARRHPRGGARRRHAAALPRVPQRAGGIARFAMAAVRDRSGLRRVRSATKTPPPLRRDTGSRGGEPRMGRSAKWIGRATSIPTRVCAIPRCQAPASATLRTDPWSPRAWLVDLDAKPIDAGASSGEDLCTRHADALAPAEGWVLHDERRRRTG